VLGLDPAQLGPAIGGILRLDSPLLRYEADTLTGEVLFADHFGNLLTSLGRFREAEPGRLKLESWVEPLPELVIKPQKYSLMLPDGRGLPLAHTFGSIPGGECAGIVGSSGLIEIAANNRSAAEALGLRRGDQIQLRPGPLA
jgi:S-adenosylmethionine hydrolase